MTLLEVIAITLTILAAVSAKLSPAKEFNLPDVITVLALGAITVILLAT